MVRTKVFVGNLSFKTKENELAEHFATAGRVASANIITRGPRSLGYGFVEMESLEEANKAVELLNKKDIDGREINVEVARPRAEPTEKPPRRPAAAPADADAPKRERIRRPPRERVPPHQAGAPATGAPLPTGGAPAAHPSAVGGEVPRRRRFRRRREGDEGAPGSPVPAGGAPTPAAAGAPPKPREPRPPREPRAPRAPKPEQPPRSASKSTLFVANLPFAVNDEELGKIFTGYNVKAAHVVTKRNGRSKGFGFVEFNTEDDQVKAQKALDKVKVQERELILKIALTENKDAAAPATETVKA